MSFVIAGNSASTGYNLQRSLRTRSSASANLSRTFGAAPTVRTKQTLSVWFKRGILSTEQVLMAGYDGVSAGGTRLVLLSGNTVEFHFAASTSLITTQVFRDPSAWYHLVLSIDTTQATASNRVKLYINGSQITAFGTANYPSQNALSQFTLNNGNNKIASQDNNANYFDGYLAEMNFIDGQSLTPSDFGETDTITGVWKPKAYSGTYGTNGFELQFTDNSAATAAAIGKDSSGNGNNWTPNNISVTAGVTYDSMTDVPTLTSATAANFCVLSPIDKNNSTVTLTNGNLNWSSGAPTYNQVCRGTIAVTSGKWYWEVTPLTNGAWANMGVCDALGTLANASRTAAGGWVYLGTNGNKMNNNSSVAYGATFTNNDVIGVALDMDSNTLTFYKNNVSQGVAYSTGFTGKTISPLMQDGANDSTAAINFGQRPFTYTPPTGFVALNTYNLPTSTIVKGNTVMDATLYTGTGATQSITNAAAFKPDLVWIKNRSAADDNQLVDSVRGVTLRLISNGTNAESANAAGLTAYNSNGFTIGSDANYNRSGSSLVGWQWQAGQGTNTTNTNGTITSTVSVNASAGFSVVTYTGTGANATVGHGLGVAPSMVIVKKRAGATTGDWAVWHTSLGTNVIYLDLTNAAAADSSWFQGVVPTSSVFSVGTAAITNQNTSTFVAYCWTPIAGFSAFGSYTGNGSTDGPFVYTGFRPKWLTVKRTDTAGTNWLLQDSVRGPYNLTENTLYPNLSDAESTGAGYFDLLSNGFKLRTSGTGLNASGGTYIYMCFAENPLKNALAR